MDPLSKYETVVDQQIREATERGEFDNLPGTGKPLRNLGRTDDELWWVREYVRREGIDGDALLPVPLQLRKQAERLEESVHALPSEEAVREEVAALNRRIAEWLRTPSGPPIPVRPVNADEFVAAWRAARPAPPPSDAVPERPEPSSRRRWWRRRNRRNSSASGA